MKQHQWRFRFPTNRDHKFQINGRKYKIGSSGIHVLTLLSGIYESCNRSATLNWSLRYRRHLRQLPIACGSGAVLSLVIERTCDANLRRLAIWLRGHCAGHVGTTSVAMFRADPDARVRKEVARTLKRLEAWGQLRKMAEMESNKRIKRIATVTPALPFEKRFAKFAQLTTRRDVPHADHKLYLSSDLVTGQGRPPKSSWLIRMILIRIKKLVAGHAR